MGNPLIVGNWKMNPGYAEALALGGQIASNLEHIKEVDVVLCPPSIYIYPLFEHLKAKPNNLAIGLQNAYSREEGAFTGEVSVKMAKGIAKYSIVGHSERRKYFHETSQEIAEKVAFLLEKNIKVVLCVGELEKFHLEDYYDSEVKKMSQEGGILFEIKQNIAKIKKSDLANLTIAYEPVWAIGTGNAAGGAYAAAVCYVVREFLEANYGEVAKEMKILYGGSVNDENAREYLMQPSIDGLLVGNSSIVSKEFIQICRIAAEVKNGRNI